MYEVLTYNKEEGGISMVKINENGIYIGDKLVEGTRGAYGNLWIENDKYVLVGVHGDDKRAGYKYKDWLFVCSKETGEYKMLWLYDKIGRFPYDEQSRLTYLEMLSKNLFSVGSDFKMAVVDADMVFKENVKPGEIIYPKPEKNDLANCFTYEICEDNAVIMRLKSGLTKMDLLKYPWFGTQYDTFKLWDFHDAKKAHLVMADSVTGNCDYRTNSDIVAENIIRQLKDCIVRCIPNHPYVRELTYFYGADTRNM
jgi:hypothetical protein